MKKLTLYTLLLTLSVLSLASCHSSKKQPPTESSTTETIQPARPSTRYDILSQQLGISIGKDDRKNIPLYEESAKWLGTPYKYAGNTRSGCDCSGLVGQIYLSVYGKQLQRNSAQIMNKNCDEISQSKLKPGDLVFFSTGGGSKINHVGILLKDDKFIHASSSKGVIVSNLQERYYQRTFVCAGRVNWCLFFEWYPMALGIVNQRVAPWRVYFMRKD